MVEANAPCSVVFDMAGDRWITLVTVSGFTNINVGGSSLYLAIRVSRLTDLLSLLIDLSLFVNGKRSGRALVYESCPSILHVENDR